MRLYFSLSFILLFCTLTAQHLPCWGCPTVSVHETLKAYHGFTLSFNAKTKLANWVCYTLNLKKITGLKVKRATKFKYDASIPGGTATHADYKKSGYDKGHLAPAADMAWSQESMNDCFYYSNIAPQYPECNRGIWKQIEEQVRRMALKSDSLVIFTGPVFNTHPDILGASKISVPLAFFKIIGLFDKAELKLFAVQIPNAHQFKSPKHYACSVEAIERQTGLLFFTNLGLQCRELKRNINLLSLYNEN